MTVQKTRRKPRGKPSKNIGSGIPGVLNAIRCEKISETIPVKVQFSLKRFLKQNAGKQGVSAWVREAIILRIREEKKR